MIPSWVGVKAKSFSSHAKLWCFMDTASIVPAQNLCLCYFHSPGSPSSTFLIHPVSLSSQTRPFLIWPYLKIKILPPLAFLFPFLFLCFNITHISHIICIAHYHIFSIQYSTSKHINFTFYLLSITLLPVNF